MSTKPVILAIDDDPEVLRAVERDLRREYGSAYRVLRADSGQAALEALRQLRLRNDPVALFLSDQRMPQMSGVEFLEQAREIYPEARRVLLTAYADTDAAIRAINSVRIDYYLMKPWDPPVEKLYPVLNDLLDDWQANYRPDYEGVRAIGHRWSPLSHNIKDFLSRNHIPYRWYDVERNIEESEDLLKLAGVSAEKLPVVIFPDGTHLLQPEINALAEKVGLKTRAEMPFYNLVIVGSGPAGLAAAVYGASEGLQTLLVERDAPGGQAGTSSRIENYLGFPVGLSGADLARRGLAQARRFGVEVLTQEALELRLDNSYKFIKLADGSEISCHALMIATGVSYRKLDIPGVERLTGAGVYYGAAQTEALSCQDDDVYIVGGANSAGQAAMFFSRYARKVVMLVRAESLAKSMSQYLIDQISETPNIEVLPFTTISEVGGEANLETITYSHTQTGETTTVPAGALFIFIGAMPRTEWLGNLVERDEQGFILAGPDLQKAGKRAKGWKLERDPFLLETSIPGIFVAGDVRHGSVKRVASGVGEGSIAVQFIHRYLAEV